MTAELPGRLEHLAARYDELYEAAEAGHIDHEEALATLAGLSVTDATGQVWAINAHGEFTAAAFAGAPAVVADPSQFVDAPAAPQPESGAPSQQPSPFAAAPAGPWDTADSPWPGADTDNHGPSVTPAGLRHDDAYPGWDDTGDHYNDLLTPPQVPAATNGYPLDSPAPTERARSLRDVEQGRDTSLVSRLAGKLPTGLAAQLSGRMPAGGGFLRNNRTFLIVVGVGVALLIAVFLHSGSSQTPSSKLPTASGGGAAAMPVDASNGKVAPLPTADDVRSVVSALSSGKQNVAQSALASKVDTATVAQLTATYYGYAHTGVDVNAGPAAAEGAGAVQVWTLQDHATQAKVAAVTVHWTKTAAGWRLAGPPTAR